MSWYYAGPDAKPVGPISLEELRARRLVGSVGPDTYVIEHPLQAGSPGSWRRYQDIFPDNFPPPPPPPVMRPTPPPPTSTVSHPLFPSAGQAPMAHPIAPPVIAPHAAPHAHYPRRPTNAFCGWGFGLGIASFIFAFACGLGMLMGFPALIICILGFVQVHQHREQSGRGLAVAGAVLALLSLVISAMILFYGIPAAIKQHEQEAAAQTSE